MSAAAIIIVAAVKKCKQDEGADEGGKLRNAKEKFNIRKGGDYLLF